MNSSTHRHISDNRGQTLVEFALILMLILVVLFGITEFGRAWQLTNSLTNGVRVGARYASTLDNTTGFENKVVALTLANITTSISGENMTVDVYRNGNVANNDFVNMTSGVPVTVKAEMDFNFLTGIMDFVFDNNSGVQEQNKLSRQATMRYE
jgi:Flp pilus assembly protein TadG